MESLESIAVGTAQGALNIVLAKAVDEIKLTWRFEDDLDNLKDRLTMLEAFLVDAGTRKSLNNLEKLWVGKVEEIATRAYDLFDKVSKENLRRQVEIEKPYKDKGSRLKARYRFFLCLSNPLGFQWRIAHQVKDVNSRIDNVFKEAHDLGIRARDLAPAMRDPSKEVVDIRQVVGREDDEKHLVEQLCRADSTGDLSVVAIVGIPGIGKSTLARRVYENEKVKESFKRIWIYVSHDFNISRILSEMVEVLAETKPKLSNIEALTKKLHWLMGGAKYLLVLDDVNTVEGEPWEALKTCLHRIGGASGSKILVTTRTSAVTDTVKVPVVYPLEGLLDVDSQALFKQIVFAHDEACPSNLMKCHKKIVDKCNGVPLAIKTIGATLQKTRNLQDWESIENNELLWKPYLLSSKMGLLESIEVDAAELALKIVLATAVDEIKLTWGFRGDLNKLMKRLTKLQEFLVDARTRKSLTYLEQLWVDKVKKVARHADDLFDEFSFETLRMKLEIKDRYYYEGSPLKARYLFFFCLANPLGIQWRMADQVKDVVSMIDDVFQEARDLGIKATKLIESNGSSGSVADRELHQCWEVPDTRQVVGRDGEEADLVEQLCGADSTGDVSFVAIVGIPGIGKTTLARHVYENEKVRKSFTKRIWIYVSDGSDINRILSEMVEVLAISQPDLPSTEALTRKLQNHMGGAKYLLVLDDVRNTVEGLWEALKTCLHRIGGSRGSMVLVTTHSNEVANAMKAPIYLKGLKVKDSWDLFQQTVFANGQACPSNLEESGKKIVGKCNGVPLAIKTLGATLQKTKNLQDWKSIENSELWKLPEYGDRIMPYLLLSFHHLPSPYLKQCFAYCSIYQKGAQIYKRDLINLWMAQGLLFLQKGSNVKNMEEIGENYFNILLNHSFLQLPERNEFGDIFECKMHDLLHDLARFVSRRDWLVGILDESSSISHLMINSDMADQMSTPPMMKIMSYRLRTIQSFVHIPNDVLMQARYVRVLQLNGIGLTNVPDVIGELKHLRYLDLSFNPLEELPESITALYNLQTLKLMGCDELDRLPRGLSKLVSLRHLLDINKFMKVPAGIERLTCLQTLPRLELSASDGEWKLHELGCLRDIRGWLQIGGLEHAKCKEEAQKAEIGAKPDISFLHLRWSSRERDEGSSELEVLDGLQPHPNLQRLQVEGFNGDSFPGWLRMTVVNNIESGQLASLDNLAVMELIDCRRCRHLPTLGQLPVLKTLVIDGMEAVGQIGPELYTQSEGNDHVQPESSSSGMTSTGIFSLFPALTRLEIKNCPNLVQWLPPESTNRPVESFPCLEKLKIVGCPLLTITPIGFPSLRHLELKHIKSVEWLLQYGKSSNLTSLILQGVADLTHLPKELCEQFTSLETLEIRRCPKLACLPEDLGKLTSLKKLEVRWCPLLKTFPEIRGLRSLIQLQIAYCRELTEAPVGLDACVELTKYELGGNGINYENEEQQPDHFVPDISPLLTVKSIRELCLYGWPKLKSLPDQLRRFTALEKLEIFGFDGLEEIPEWIGKLSSLRQLGIYSCRNPKHDHCDAWDEEIVRHMD